MRQKGFVECSKTQLLYEVKPITLNVRQAFALQQSPCSKVLLSRRFGHLKGIAVIAMNFIPTYSIAVKY
jgi:hypothetical protein